MPTTTNGLPYPAPGDAPDGAAQIKALAEALPVHRVPTAMAAGAARISLSSQVIASAVVTFPAGRFSAAPRVSVTPQGTSVYSAHNLGAPTATSVTVGVRKIDGLATTGDVDVSWFAVQGLG
jgi:hypothetical protein